MFTFLRGVMYGREKTAQEYHGVHRRKSNFLVALSNRNVAVGKILI